MSLLDTTGPRHLCVEVAPRADLDRPPAGSPAHIPGYHSRATAPTAPRPAPRPTQPIPAQHDPFDGEHSQPGISPRVGIDRERRVAEPWGFCAACLSGAPRTRSNNSGRTDFEYGHPFGMTTSKSTEVALPV